MKSDFILRLLLYYEYFMKIFIKKVKSFEELLKTAAKGFKVLLTLLKSEKNLFILCHRASVLMGQMPVEQKAGVLHMTEWTMTKVKAIQILLFAVVIVMLFFGGCGSQEAVDGARLENMAVPLSGGVDINAIGTEEWRGSQELREAEHISDTENADDAGNVSGVTLNPDDATVTYQGAAFMSSCRTIGGDSIYSTGFLGEFDGSHPVEGAYFAGRIGLEEDAVQQFALEIPDNMFAYRGCTDSQGRWHLMLAQKTGNTVEPDEKAEIWVINRDGELEQSFDITECVKEGGWWSLWMEVDSDGIYYLASNEKIEIIDAVNQSVAILHFSGSINGIGIGRSGALYGVFEVEGNEMLGIVDTENGSIEKCADLPENDVRPTFSALQEGVNTELLLANMGDGIWSYDGAELTQKLTLENIVANGQDILAMGFMWDGRVCIMSYEEGKYIFHYAPVET